MHVTAWNRLGGIDNLHQPANHGCRVGACKFEHAQKRERTI